MKKRLIFLLILVLALTNAAVQAQAASYFENRARTTLERLGVAVSDEAFESFVAMRGEYRAYYAQEGAAALSAVLDDLLSDPAEAAYELLIKVGLGDCDYETDVRTPFSDQVYAFDAEVYDVERMYTLFLQGVDHIVPDAQFTGIEEDLSGIRWDDEAFASGDEGARDVSFLCNGKPYRFTLVNQHDWFDSKMIDHTNAVLEEAGCLGRLHMVSGWFDQMVVLYYGSETEAQALEALAAQAYGFDPEEMFPEE